MPGMSSSLVEQSRSESPNTAGFSMQGGRSSRLYNLEPVDDTQLTQTDLDEVITYILGSSNRGGDGRIDRVLPIADPQWPWMFANNIANIQGIGVPEPGAIEPELEAPAIGGHAFYPTWRFRVDFLPRDYAVLSNDSIQVTSDHYFPDNDTGSGSGTAFSYANEWLRFTDWEVQPMPELLEAQQGQSVYVLDASNVSVTFTNTTPPHAYSYPARPRMVIPKGAIRFRWWQVPYSYVVSANSHIIDNIGRVNQRDWFKWKAGELLYMGCTVKRYTPPIPERTDVLNGNEAFSIEKLCDIEFLFDYTRRTQTTVPTLSNRSIVTAGHNLIPWLGDRQFYMAVTPSGSTPNTVSTWVPTWLSFPVEKLFTDPDA